MFLLLSKNELITQLIFINEALSSKKESVLNLSKIKELEEICCINFESFFSAFFIFVYNSFFVNK